MNQADQPSILVVDDDKEVLTSFRVWLSSEGFTPFTASSSSEALKILDEEHVEVALLDFRLGTENGLTTAKMLKDAEKDIKIIIITGYPSPETAVESMKAGLFDYLSKGTSNEKILETVKDALQAREKEMLEKGEALLRAPLLRYIVVCRHSLIKERLENFSINFPDFKMVRTYNSIEKLEEVEYVPEVDIALVCATCCIESFDNAFVFFNKFYKILPTVKPVLFNESFSENQKVDLIRIGVRGFFSIDMNSQTLEKALLLIKKGEIWAGRKLSSLAVPSGPEYLKNYIPEEVDNHGLSGREKEILRAMVMGLKNREIADKLFISEMTVKSHINRIYKKFGVNNRAKAILLASENKIL
ncbi:MAG: response regulator [bacterium]|nr:response regulator [bacterium]